MKTPCSRTPTLARTALGAALLTACGGCDIACDPGLSCQDSACVELETCDGVDNDADRVVDEGSQGEGAATEVVRGALAKSPTIPVMAFSSGS